MHNKKRDRKKEQHKTKEVKKERKQETNIARCLLPLTFRLLPITLCLLVAILDTPHEGSPYYLEGRMSHPCTQSLVYGQRRHEP